LQKLTCNLRHAVVLRYPVVLRHPVCVEVISHPDAILHMVMGDALISDMVWLWLVGSIKLEVSFAKETYKRDDILQKRPIILWILLTVATPYLMCV